MSIIVPDRMKRDPLFVNLMQHGASVISEEAARMQDIRPARIGLLNLMPAAAMGQTEEQWLKYISHTLLQIEPVLLKFDDDFRERDGASRAKHLSRYESFSRATEHGLDGLIITGDNLELDQSVVSASRKLLGFKEIRYAAQLEEVARYARKNIYSTIYSCLASHFALHAFYGLQRSIGQEKIFGVYSHKVPNGASSEMMMNMNDEIIAPHSRWGDVPTEALLAARISVLASNDKIGWLLAEDKNDADGHDLYIQGHPEYDKYDMDSEYRRDSANGQKRPEDYYILDDPDLGPHMSWATDARALHSNWIASIYKHFSSDQPAL